MSSHYNTPQAKFKHLTASERLLIATWYNQEGKSKREIARLLGKSDKAIRDELKKGTMLLNKSLKRCCWNWKVRVETFQVD